ncbi:MAG TPA: hypothetical protein VJ917_00720 [Saprospiraceae bacterium]|nr:hypothetical protein [Saprospiraceae bacterium]
MGKVIPNVASWIFYLSYLREFTLESFYSDKNGHIELFLRKGHLMLCAENAIYSYDEKYENFVFAFEQLDPNDLKGLKNVLVLGMGLGSIPLILERQYSHDFNFTMVEYDEDIADLAQTYSLPRIEGHTEIVMADALAYMQLNERTFDLICIDLFKDKDIPDEFLTASFLQLCSKALSAQGLVIMNTPGNTMEESCNSEKYYENDFRKVFPKAARIHLFKNEMLFSRAPSNPLLYGQ